MRLLILNARYVPEGIGGPAHTARFLAEQLVREGHEVTVFCRSPQPGSREESLTGVKVLRIGLEQSRQTVLDAFERTLDRYTPVIIHTLFPREFPLQALPEIAVARGIRLVHTLLEFNLLCPRSLIRDGLPCETQCVDCRTVVLPLQRFAESVDAVVGISRYMLNLHQKMGLFCNTRIQAVIHDAYEPPASRSEHETFVHANTGPIRMGFLGRIDPSKGVDLLLKTLTSELSTEHWSVFIGGNGSSDYVSNLRRKYADKRICFLGFVDPSELLSKIDVLVVPSIWEEPLGRIVFEAYAHGLPVVASQRGGIPEMVEEGSTGLLFDPDNAGDLAKALRCFLNYKVDMTEMRSSAYRKWRLEFTPEAIAHQYEKVYERVLVADEGGKR
jgi:glycosyltransferase involved in cell wall biosynthesis